MRNKRYLGLFVIILTVFFICPVHGQNIFPIQQEGSVADTAREAVVTPIALDNINNASAKAFTLFSQAGADRLTVTDRTLLSGLADSITKKTGKLFADTAGVNFDRISFRDLDQLQNRLLLQQDEIADMQRRINDHFRTLQAWKQSLQKSRERWALTLQRSAPEDLPPAIASRISNVISSNDSIRRILQNDIDFLLTQSDKVTGSQIRLDRFRDDLVGYGKISGSKVFRRDMPPVWSMFSVSDTLQEVGHWQNFRTGFRSDSRKLVEKSSGRLVFIAALFLFLLSLVFWLKLTVKNLDIKERTVFLSLYVNEIFQKPVEVALLVGLYIGWLVIPDMPASYASMMAIVSVYAILRIALDILPQGYRKFMIGFAIAYILFRFYNLFYDQHIFSRLILMAAQTVTLVYLVVFINSRRLIYSAKRKAFSYILSVLAVIYLIFMTVAFAGNLFGILSFSEYLSGGIIKSGFMVISTYVGFHVTAALVYLVIASAPLRRSNIIREQSAYIFGKIYSFLRLLFILAWIFVALDQFHVRDAVVAWGETFFTRQISIGKAAFSLINIVLFVFVIWLSMLVSRIVRHILKEEVFPRVKVERGIPGTIIMLVRIALITIGFLLAAAAAGMKLSSLTIIIGAFSVGIGFGLQNIFNNLVSGLILAFERPIKEGDTVEVNSLLGVVLKIGIRSSVVRTYDGAEVIVPNGSLISNDLINWTLSDAQRRVDIRVGVAYGTDPEKVLEILLKAAREHPNAIADPAPRAFFLGFGDSSLDFRLLAWTDLDHRLEMESEIKVAINKAIIEAGIEIPFPQTDLHIRSVDPEAGDRLRSKK